MRLPRLAALCPLALTLIVANPAGAQSLVLKPLADARLRYERVEQDGIAKDADAVTIRVRTGVSATRGHLSALVEAQGNLAIVNHYDDTVSGPSRRAAVGDPENIALYRAQLQYKADAVTATAGRQKITLDDERFVGAANWRQNGRTYDAARFEWAVLPQLKADLIYSWSVRGTSGINGTGAKPPAIDGVNVFVNLAAKTPIGTLTGFAYLIDQDEQAVQGFRLSSQTYGARLAGNRALAPSVKLNWALSYARQSDYHRNPNDYRASYYLADAGLEVSAARLGAGYEVLGADRGTALTSFQTPLASIFKFQGWADKFTTTPANGVRDLYGSAGWTWKRVGPLTGILIQGVYHRFDSDRLSMDYGDEVDLLASAKWRRYTVSARYADYHADSFATNTRKFWLELDYVL
ncbi:hypothetical protein SAMN05192583_2026 [Sphingomonas gellani]|uniref:Alginate export domain-containing protein n=2 Tax=Sphingomonas gellani TaxID=1166340 RepID=A0A1H8DRH5_9SPHN|nr:alginate export family protein [Sphingomonas gellani]SEN09766.1 hypothetical protein SAMN05192583_2026 [Sphingomonas gellani]